MPASVHTAFNSAPLAPTKRSAILASEIPRVKFMRLQTKSSAIHNEETRVELTGCGFWECRGDQLRRGSGILFCDQCDPDATVLDRVCQCDWWPSIFWCCCAWWTNTHDNITNKVAQNNVHVHVRFKAIQLIQQFQHGTLNFTISTFRTLFLKNKIIFFKKKNRKERKS